MKPKLVVLTGAGISAESGVKTFRDHDGLWEGHDVYTVASIDSWHEGPKNRQLMLDFYNQRRRQLDTVEPNEAHKLLASLEEIFDVTIITQNVDDLHERGGSSKVIHLHGELKKACSSNNKNLTVPYDKDIQLGDKHEDGSQLRPFIVWFGEAVPKIELAQKETKQANIFVVIGTSLQVYPAAGLLTYAMYAPDIYVIDNNIPEEVKQEGYNVICIEKPATEGMAELVNVLKEKYGSGYQV